MASQKLFVGGLPFSTSTDRLRDLFAQAVSGVESVTVVTDPTGQSRGFGFVEMATPEAAQVAIQKLDGLDLDGRRLKVEIANAKPIGGARRNSPPSAYRARGRW